jgi:secreted trypsin-like serine protease
MRRVFWQLAVPLGLSLAVTSACALDEGADEIGAASDPIVGGNDTTIDQHPWQIALTTNAGFQFCGGSILNPNWVVTAQHCVTGGNADMRVVAGITRKSQQSTGQIRAVDAIATFPGFTDPTAGKDVALLHLRTPLDLTGPNARSIPLVTATDATNGATAPGVTSTVTGWGTLSSGGPTPDILQEVDIPLVSNAQAQNQYGPQGVTITSDQLGAGIIGVGGVDSCQGDSGGPLTVPFAGTNKLGGVVSWGFGCADPQFPGMYARVSSFATYISNRANGVTNRPINLTSLSGAAGTFTHRSVTVPTGARVLSAVLRGGTGDADLYVRFGSQPTTSTFNCRPFLNGNFEFCTFNAPAAGTWFVSLRAFSAFSGAALTVAVVTP